MSVFVSLTGNVVGQVQLPNQAPVQTPFQAPTQAQPEGRLASVNGMQMYYEVYGEGRPLVLLHGFKASSEVWRPIALDFAKQHRVIVPDLRGHGRSTNPAKQFTHRQSALDVFGLLDLLKIDQFSAIGISSGGMSLLHMATQRPDRVEAMILIGATMYFPDEARALMGQTTIESITPEEWQHARRIHKLGDDQIRELVRQFNALKDSYDDMNFTPPFLSKIRARTLIIHGDRDPFFPVPMAVEMYRAIPQAYLWVIPNGGHVPVFGDPGYFVKTSLEFLQVSAKAEEVRPPVQTGRGR
ncbi:MAG: alpha/beta hydrolase [Verrucomicrobia bacterium]|nr:alpha/beta hydrolase [Verrucomicrobiota bacterium]